MSKNMTKNKNTYQNYLTLANNCKIVTNGAKPLPHLNPENILTDNVRQVWLSNELPASCTVNLRNMIQRPMYFNRIGFNCWHEYQSNPKLIEIEFTSQESMQNANWIVLAKIRLELVSGWQHFKLPATSSKSISLLKITVLQNHSEFLLEDNQNEQSNAEVSTYLNQVSLGYVQETIQSRVQPVPGIVGNNTGNANMHSRQKTFSDYRKLTSSQKQIKKITEKMKSLANQNEIMKRTIDHQSTIIIKLQEAVHSLAENVSKLQKIQSIQQIKLTNMQKYEKQPKNRHDPFQKQKLRQFFDNQVQTNGNQRAKQYLKDKQRLILRHNSIYEEHQSSLSNHNSTSKQNSTSKHNSIYKSNKGKSHQKSQKSKKRQVINVNIRESQNSLSEYEGVVDQRSYHYGGKRQQKWSQQRKISEQQKKSSQKKYIPMIEKLQELIILRDQKKNKLRTHKKGRNAHNEPISSEEQKSVSSNQY